MNIKEFAKNGLLKKVSKKYNHKVNYGLFYTDEEPIFLETYNAEKDFIPGMIVYNYTDNTFSTNGYVFEEVK